MEGYHEIVRPVREIVSSLGERVLNWVLPSDVLNGLIQTESAKRTYEMFRQEQIPGLEE